jgi:hypothetical protein
MTHRNIFLFSSYHLILLLQESNSALPPVSIDEEHAELIDALVLLLCDRDEGDVGVCMMGHLGSAKSMPVPSSQSATAAAATAAAVASSSHITSAFITPAAALDAATAIGRSGLIAPADVGGQPELNLLDGLGDKMGVFGSAVVQLAEAVMELSSQQQQQQQQQQQLQQQQQQQQQLILQQLADEHLQRLSHQQQLLEQQQQQQQHSSFEDRPLLPPAVEARLLLLEEVCFLH